MLNGYLDILWNGPITTICLVLSDNRFLYKKYHRKHFSRAEVHKKGKIIIINYCMNKKLNKFCSSGTTYLIYV